MKLKNFINTNSQQLVLAIGLGVSAILLTIGGFSYRSTESFIQSLESLRNGLSICTTRVGQSHYALLSGSQSPKALTSNYFSSTDECFFQFDRKVDELGLVAFEGYSNDIYDEFINYKNMAKNFDVGNVPISRVSSSYNRIDQLRFDIGTVIAKEVRSEQSTLTAIRYGIIFAICLLGTSLVLYLLGWSSRRKSFKEIEQAAYSVLGESSENTTEVERLIEQVLDQLRMPAIKNLFLEYNTLMLEKAYPNQRAIEYSSSEDSMKQNARNSSVKNFDLDEEYINSVFEKTAEKSDVIELTAEDLELTEEEILEDQWVSSSSLNNDSSLEFTLADEFDQMVSIDHVDEEINNTSTPVVSEAVTPESNFELKQISAKVKEVLGEVAPDTEKETPVNFDHPIGQKISSMIAQENTVEDSEATETKGEGITFQKLLSKITKAYLKRQKNSEMKWEFSTDYQDFNISDNQETIEQVLYSVMARFDKGFTDLEISPASRMIRITSNDESQQGCEVNFTLRGILFNTAELEYLNHNEQSVRRLIDLNLVTAQELISELGGNITLRNVLGDGNIKEGIVNILIPHNDAQISASSSAPMLKRIVKGTKAKLLKSLRRETTI